MTDDTDASMIAELRGLHARAETCIDEWAGAAFRHALVAAFPRLLDIAAERDALKREVEELRKTLACALADPEHGEYEAIVEAVAGLAEMEPMPKREVPLAFLTMMLDGRRTEYRALLPAPPAAEGK